MMRNFIVALVIIIGRGPSIGYSSTAAAIQTSNRPDRNKIWSSCCYISNRVVVGRWQGITSGCGDWHCHII